MTKLREAQTEALKRRGDKTGFAYFMEQGLGKTLTILSDFMQIRQKDGRLDLMVIVCPSSFRKGWCLEAKKFNYPWEIIRYHSSKHAAVRSAILKQEVRIVVINYEAIRLDKVQKLVKELADKSTDNMIVFDESIAIQNNKSIQAKAAINLSKMFTHRRILSGKPITQNAHNLWGQLRAIGELNGVNYYAFRNRYCVMGGYMSKQVVGTKNEEQLMEILNSCSFVARKKEYAKDLPPKDWVQHEVPLHSDIRNMYEEMQQHMLLKLEDGSIASADLVLTRLLRQTQIASGYTVNEDREIVQLVPLEKNYRLIYAIEYYNQIQGKLVVPARFKPTIANLKTLCEKYKIKYTTLEGGMSDDEVEDSKAYFNDGDAQIMILNSQFAKYSHTLHAHGECSNMYFAENDYNLDTRSQVEDRIHRYGQVADMCLYADGYSTDIDYDMVVSLAKKESVAAKFLGYDPEMFNIGGLND